MPDRRVISVVLEAHEAFFCKTAPTCAACSAGAVNPVCAVSSCLEEVRFFESLSETYLPLVEMLERLERDRVPFRLGIALSPILCHHLKDRELLERYVGYIDKQIEFGERELRRHRGSGALKRLARYYYDKAIERRFAFTERYEGNILRVLDGFQHRGKIEILASGATHAFLPFFVSYPEAIQAQIEVALSSDHRCCGKSPQGFFLSEMGWSGELEKPLRAYNLGYTIVEAHGLLYGNPPAEKGSFYPVRTPQGVFVLGRDYYGREDLRELSRRGPYRDNRKDAGYELPARSVAAFLGPGGARQPTGYKYRAQGEEAEGAGDYGAPGGRDAPEAGERGREGAASPGSPGPESALDKSAGRTSAGPGGRGSAGPHGGPGTVYDPAAAAAQADRDAGLFLRQRLSRLETAAALMDEAPLCLCVFKAGDLGRSWYEGFDFLEHLFRRGAEREDLRFMTPAQYLYQQESPNFQTSVPGFSSQGFNGYGETWLGVTNDWMYRHVFRALERMIELAERFPDDTGLKERALNQAAREILLVQSSDWPGMLYRQESSGLARSSIEDALRNFTTIYEALGSNYISTEWLTGLERRHSIFPHINYRIFRRKK
jgi:1,4-alpha-glucan branching enzyme